MKMKISFVIPVYRNEGSIHRTYKTIKSIFSAALTAYKYEMIFVDDGSDDGSLSEILNIRKRDSHVKAIIFTRNFGQMAAMLAGFKEASGDAVVNISADLQDPVELIVKMVKKWRAGSEIVVCYRTDRSDSFIARLSSRFAYGALRLSNSQIPSGGFDFIMMGRKALNTFNSIDIRNRFFQGDLLWMGYSISFIPYVRLKRVIGKSQFTLTKKLKYFLDAFLDSSYLSIRFISFCGIITAFVGMIYGITIIYSWLHGETPFAGWAPIMIIILIVGGLVMIMLGIIGEYIWRIYDEVRKKPNFIIKDKFL